MKKVNEGIGFTRILAQLCHVVCALEQFAP
jgi:hypothetical protein